MTPLEIRRVQVERPCHRRGVVSMRWGTGYAVGRIDDSGRWWQTLFPACDNLSEACHTAREVYGAPATFNREEWG